MADTGSKDRVRQTEGWPERIGAPLVRWAIFGVLLWFACSHSATFVNANRRTRVQPEWIADWSYGFAAAGLLLFLAGIPRVLSRFHPLLLGLALAHLVLALVVRWSHAFNAFLPTMGVRREVFRRRFVRPALPIYGEATSVRDSAVLAAWGIGVVLVLIAWPWITRRMNRFVGWALILALSGAAMFSAAWIESPRRYGGSVGGYDMFSIDLVAFKGPRDILDRYVEEMPSLNWFNRHYPPGNLMLFRMQEGLRDGNRSVRQTWSRYLDARAAAIANVPKPSVVAPSTRPLDADPDASLPDADEGDDEVAATGPAIAPEVLAAARARRVRMPELPTPAFVRSIVIAAALLAIPLFAALGRELGLRRSSARLAACVIAISAAIVTYTTISMTPLLLLPTAVIWWSFQRGLRTGERWCGIACGTAVFVYAFFSFSVSVVGLVMCVAMLAQLATGRADWRRALSLALAAAIACAVLWLGTWAGTGYNALACMLTAIHQHGVQQGTNPFVPIYMWWLRSSGNLTAYLFTIAPLPGVALALLFAGRRAWRSRVGCWLLGTLVAIGVASFGGLFWLETERLWIFLTPLFAIAACGAIDRLVPARTRLEARLGLLIASTAFVLTFEAVFKPYL